MVNYRILILAIASLIISGCEPGASRGFAINASKSRMLTLFDQEVNKYLLNAGFSIVEMDDPLYPHRTLYKKYPVNRDQTNVMISVQLTYGDGLKPEVIVGEWVANSLSPASEQILSDIKDMANKYGLLMKE